MRRTIGHLAFYELVGDETTLIKVDGDIGDSDTFAIDADDGLRVNRDAFTGIERCIFADWNDGDIGVRGIAFVEMLAWVRSEEEERLSESV